MTLKDFLAQQGMTCEAFAKKIGVHTPSVWRYANGQRIPRGPIMGRIVEATGGAVTANDFYAQDEEGAAA